MSSDHRPFISVVLPCYNEEAILTNNLNTIVRYLDSRKDKYSWEIVLINDGSTDDTKRIALEFAQTNERVKVINHPVNLNLGQALQTGFRHSSGEVIVVYDIDLSYHVDHIEAMVETLIEKNADLVIASPYMKGGRVTAVPMMRKVMSKWINKLMRFAAQDKYHTYTGMVRAYRSDFIKALNLKTRDYEVNPEVMYKAMILRARMIEIPAHLDWTEQNKYKGKRTSSIRIIRGVFSGIMSSFIFRPYVFFFSIGAFLMVLSLYELFWLLFDTLNYLPVLRDQSPNLEYAFSISLAAQFQRSPHTFIVGGITFIAAIQFLSLGFLSLQNKRYFEELFHLTTSVRKIISEKQ
jgi:glycosyltransferase involved in cell wall biosynthesis